MLTAASWADYELLRRAITQTHNVRMYALLFEACELYLDQFYRANPSKTNHIIEHHTAGLGYVIVTRFAKRISYPEIRNITLLFTTFRAVPDIPIVSQRFHQLLSFLGWSFTVGGMPSVRDELISEYAWKTLEDLKTTNIKHE